MYKNQDEIYIEEKDIILQEILNKDEVGMFDIMEEYKPLIHLHKFNNTFTLQAMVKIPAMRKHTSTCLIERGANNSRLIRVNVNKDNNVLEPYLIFLELDFKTPSSLKDPLIGVWAIGPGTPEEGQTMVGEDDADERP